MKKLIFIGICLIPFLLSMAGEKPSLGRAELRDGYIYDTFYYRYDGKPEYLKQVFNQVALPHGVEIDRLNGSSFRGMESQKLFGDVAFPAETVNAVNLNIELQDRDSWIKFRDAMAKKGVPVWPVVSYYGPHPYILNGEMDIVFLSYTKADEREALLKKYALEVAEVMEPNTDYVTVKLPLGSDPFEIANEIFRTGKVFWAQPNYYTKYVSMGQTNDPYLSRQWHHDMINTYSAWDVTTGSPDIKVAVIDSGVETNHPDLAANIDQIVPMDGYYYDLLSGDNDPNPQLSGYGQEAHAGLAHGTACAGLIAGVGNNGIGVSGICQNCKIIPIRMIGGNPVVNNSQYKAIMLAVERGAGVINNSYGRPNRRDNGSEGMTSYPCINNGDNSAIQAVKDAKKYGRNGKGTITVWAAGNNTCNSNLTPQYQDDDFVVVAALENGGASSTYSNYGAEIDVSAPAGSVTTDNSGSNGMNSSVYGDSLPSEYTSNFGGTSAAAPVTCGAIALMLSANPDMDFQAAVSCLKNAAKRINKPCRKEGTTYNWQNLSDPYVQGGSKEHSYCFGYGMVDAAAMVAGAKDNSCASACIATSEVDLCYGAGYQKDDDCDKSIDENCDDGGDGKAADPCERDAQCGNVGQKAYCKKEWDGGYCTAECQDKTDCYNGGNVECYQGMCVAKCSWNEIRSGYACIANKILPEGEKPEPNCGNNLTEEGETCDGNTRSCKSIDSEFTGGYARCKDDCSGYNLSTCEGDVTDVCGDGNVSGPEVCDGGKKPCSEIDSSRPVGNASCKSDCSGWDSSSCSGNPSENCGNGVVDEGEKCDGSISACKDIDPSYKTGVAKCKPDCSDWDLSACEDGAQASSACGDGEVTPGETCDGNNALCSSLNSIYTAGAASCLSDCSGFDLSNCETEAALGRCGNGTVDAGEICDGNITKCSDVDKDFGPGVASCNSKCTGWNTSGCSEATASTDGEDDGNSGIKREDTGCSVTAI